MTNRIVARTFIPLAGDDDDYDIAEPKTLNTAANMAQ